MEIVHLFRSLADSNRLRIVHLLTHSPLCVSHLQEVLGLPQTKVSQHLAHLRRAGIVRARRHCTWMIYTLAPQPHNRLSAMMAFLHEHARSEKIHFMDLKRLEKMMPGLAWIEKALEGPDNPELEVAALEPA